MQDLILNGEKKTLEFGKLLANCLDAYIANIANSSLVIFLNGNLGAGKTTMVRGIIKALGFAGKVKSPSYSLVEEYDNLKNIGAFYHFDLYRLAHPEELEFLGIREYLAAPNSVAIVEWPEKGNGFLPNPDLTLAISILEDKRKFKVSSNSKPGDKIIHALEQNINNFNLC